MPHSDSENCHTLAVTFLTVAPFGPPYDSLIVAARFMLQFVNVQAGPMLALHGSGVYLIQND